MPTAQVAIQKRTCLPVISGCKKEDLKDGEGNVIGKRLILIVPYDATGANFETYEFDLHDDQPDTVVSELTGGIQLPGKADLTAIEGDKK